MRVPRVWRCSGRRQTFFFPSTEMQAACLHLGFKGALSMSIINPTAASRALQLCRDQRVAVTGLFNSNGLQGGYGLIEAIQQSFVNAGIKLFAAGPVTLTCTDPLTNASNFNVTPRSNFSCVGWQRVITSEPSVPSPNNKLLSVANTLALTTFEARRYIYGRANEGLTPRAPIEYPTIYRGLHFQNNSAVAFDGSAGGISFGATAANALHMNPAAAIRTDHWYSNATPAGGTFRPVALTNSVPNTTVVQSATVTVPAGTATAMSRHTWDVTAGVRDTQLRIGPVGGTVFNRPTGEVFFGFQVSWELDALTGVLVAPFQSNGGWSTYDFANNLARTDGDQCYDEAIDHWIDVVTRPTIDAGQDPVMIFFIAEGSNEASETATSITVGDPGGTAAAYEDNVGYIMTRWKARWAAKGLAADNLIFALYTDHPNWTSGETARANIVEGSRNLCAAFPSNTFGFDALGSWTAAELANVGIGNESFYDRPNTSESITSIPTAASGAFVSASVVNAYAAGQFLRVASTNSTPNINGIWQISSRDVSSVLLVPQFPAFAITGAGTSGQARQLDTLHLASNGVNGATASGYQPYWQRLFDAWEAATPSVGGGGSRPLSLGMGLSV
jgi:hypothetical protein